MWMSSSKGRMDRDRSDWSSGEEIAEPEGEALILRE